MERSRYNVIVEHGEGEHVVFNTLTGTLAVLSEDAYKDYLGDYSQYGDKLADAGVLVESAVEELEMQRRLFDRDQMSRNWLTLCILPTYSCNYACPYCYEHGHTRPGSMQPDVIDAICRFVERMYERDGFGNLFVQWFGGEPTLCLGVIEELSRRIQDFCTEHDISFQASMATNGGLVDDEAAKILKRSGIEYARPTIDGLPELHNKRRVARGNVDSFKATLNGVRAMRDAGIVVEPTMNMDHKSVDDYRILRKKLKEEEGINMQPAMIKNYRGDYGCPGFCAPEFDLFSREEYAQALHGLFEETPYSAEVLTSILSPSRVFCRGQIENYYVIDFAGDVYKCDGYVGEDERVLFNLTDDYDVDALHTALCGNPLDDEKCWDCVVLPFCKGGCVWDRSKFEEPCHMMHYSLELYVHDYRDCFGAVDEPVTVLVAPTSFEERFSEDYDGKISSGSSSYAGLVEYPEEKFGAKLRAKYRVDTVR